MKGLFLAAVLAAFAFSDSSVFSRRASDTSMPPYLDRHL